MYWVLLISTLDKGEPQRRDTYPLVEKERRPDGALSSWFLIFFVSFS